MKPIEGRSLPKIGFRAWCKPFAALSGQGGISFEVPLIGTKIEWSSPMVRFATVEFDRFSAEWDSLKE